MAVDSDPRAIERRVEASVVVAHPVACGCRAHDLERGGVVARRRHVAADRVGGRRRGLLDVLPGCASVGRREADTVGDLKRPPTQIVGPVAIPTVLDVQCAVDVRPAHVIGGSVGLCEAGVPPESVCVGTAAPGWRELERPGGGQFQRWARRAGERVGGGEFVVMI